ncbi:hypothetical protein GOBAR_DD15465 [Gossypium barbadense]|nr:hypothetical protein GOBAR_DD15465 [Gossypium barbadense]
MLAQDTIKTIVVNNAKNISPMKINNEKKRFLERRQLKENTKTSRSSSASTRMKEKIESKKKREVSRIALENMENTVGIQLNLEVQKEFEILIESSSSWKPIASSRFPSSTT